MCGEHESPSHIEWNYIRIQWLRRPKERESVRSVGYECGGVDVIKLKANRNDFRILLSMDLQMGSLILLIQNISQNE